MENELHPFLSHIKKTAKGMARFEFETFFKEKPV